MTITWLAGLLVSVTPTLKSGIYDGQLQIGLDPASQVVTGYFSSATGGGQFTCQFLFSGKLEENGAAIVTSDIRNSPEEPIPGRLEASGNRVTLRLSKDPGGCWNVQHFADKADPAMFELAASKAWLALRQVAAKKAFFRDRPDDAARRHSYVVRGDAVAILQRSGNWVQVEYQSIDKPVTGWIRSDEVAGEFKVNVH